MDNNENIQNTIPIKIILVGSINVGKTSLVTRYATGKFHEISKSTKNCSYISKTKKINGKNYEIRLWDTAGQEKYKSVTKIFIKDANIAILVFAIDNEKSFEDLKDWLQIIKNVNDENLIFGIAANKSDLKIENNFDEKAKNFAKNIGGILKKTSAIIENGGFEELLDELIFKYLNNTTVLDSTGSLSITLSTNNSGNNKKGCCGGGKSTVKKKSRVNTPNRGSNVGRTSYKIGK